MGIIFVTIEFKERTFKTQHPLDFPIVPTSPKYFFIRFNKFSSLSCRLIIKYRPKSQPVLFLGVLDKVKVKHPSASVNPVTNQARFD